MSGPVVRQGSAVAETSGPNPSAVPDGTVGEVLTWVGDDSSRAQQAYDVEEGSDSPRSTLLAELQKRGAQ